MIPWKTFKGRRKIDLASLIENANITTYEGLVEHLVNQSVGPPSKEEFDSVLGVSQIRAESQSTVSKETGRRSTPRKATQKKTGVKDNPDEVWQDGLEGSYQTKKPTRKPRTPRKTTPRKKS